MSDRPSTRWRPEDETRTTAPRRPARASPSPSTGSRCTGTRSGSPACASSDTPTSGPPRSTGQTGSRPSPWPRPGSRPSTWAWPSRRRTPGGRRCWPRAWPPWPTPRRVVSSSAWAPPLGDRRQLERSPLREPVQAGARHPAFPAARLQRRKGDRGVRHLQREGVPAGPHPRAAASHLSGRLAPRDAAPGRAGGRRRHPQLAERRGRRQVGGGDREGSGRELPAKSWPAFSSSSARTRRWPATSDAA